MPFEPACPAPAPPSGTVQLAHGGGGSLMHRLLARVILPPFHCPALAAAHDGAVLEAPGRIAFTTDGYVVRPLEFPGGDIGTLAVHGTVNDLAMCGARPLWLSAAFILEEGLPLATLERVVASMARAAAEAGVSIVTGDTKVVDRGHGDGIFITTAGVGRVEAPGPIAPGEVRPGDAILVSGDLGRHGMAILSVREGLAFESSITSDCAPLAAPVLDLLAAGIPIHCLRDLTRGGLASALHEIAEASGLGMVLDEPRIPVEDAVRAACEILGLDPLYVANEGRFAAFVPATHADAALERLRRHPVSRNATVIGEVTPRGSVPVTLRGTLGSARLLPFLSGEQLPRIC